VLTECHFASKAFDLACHCFEVGSDDDDDYF
jgi:hypothetical protein